jgi:lysophospholipase L1-like esterase
MKALEKASDNRQNKAGWIIAAAVAVCALAALCIAGFLYVQGKELREDLKRLEQGNYGFVYLSMSPVDTLSEEEIRFYYGCEMFRTERPMTSVEEIRKYLKILADGQPDLRYLYLGIRPDLVSFEELAGSEEYGRLLETHPELRLVFHPSYPSVEYWKVLSEEECMKELTAYGDFLSAVSEAGTAYFYGGAEWLVSNPELYAEEFCLREDLTLPLLEADGYQVTADSWMDLAADLREVVLKYREGNVSYPDLSDTRVVIFGDSIFGNFTDDLGSAKILQRTTGAEVYNLAIGGASWCRKKPEDMCIGDEIDLLLGTSEKEEPREDYAAARALLGAADGKKTVVLVEFGVNDYFGGFEMGTADSGEEGTVLGSMNVNLARLREIYPDAEIVVLAPGEIRQFSFGEDSKAEGAGTLADYRAAILSQAEAQGLRTVDLAETLDTPREELYKIITDGTHLNERGRFLLAVKLGELLAE